MQYFDKVRLLSDVKKLLVFPEVEHILICAVQVYGETYPCDNNC